MQSFEIFRFLLVVLVVEIPQVRIDSGWATLTAHERNVFDRIRCKFPLTKEMAKTLQIILCTQCPNQYYMQHANVSCYNRERRFTFITCPSYMYMLQIQTSFTLKRSILERSTDFINLVDKMNFSMLISTKYTIQAISFFL